MLCIWVCQFQDSGESRTVGRKGKRSPGKEAPKPPQPLSSFSPLARGRRACALALSAAGLAVTKPPLSAGVGGQARRTDARLRSLWKHQP